MKIEFLTQLGTQQQMQEKPKNEKPVFGEQAEKTKPEERKDLEKIFKKMQEGENARIDTVNIKASENLQRLVGKLKNFIKIPPKEPNNHERFEHMRLKPTDTTVSPDSTKTNERQ